MKTRTLSILILGLLGCSGTDSVDHEENIDPRCQSICVIEEPSLEGAYDICSDDSADLCKDECSTRIESASSLCASCLLEGADYGLELSPRPSDFCENGQCEKIGREGRCTYPQGDDQARDDCTRQVYPRREVHCDAEFAPVVDCAAVCDSGEPGGTAGDQS